jgi:hypothetical protein
LTVAPVAAELAKERLKVALVPAAPVTLTALAGFAVYDPPERIVTPVTAPSAPKLVTFKVAAAPNVPPTTVRTSLRVYPLPPLTMAPVSAVVVTSVTLAALSGATMYAPAWTIDSPLMPKPRVKVAPEAAGVVVSVTLTGLAGTAVYDPPVRTVAPVTTPAVTLVTCTVATAEDVPPVTLRMSPTT